MDFIWYGEDILHIRYGTRVSSWDEYIQCNQAACAAVRTTGRTCPIYIIHTPGRVQMPKGNPLPQMRAVFQFLPPNVIVYAVVDNAFARLMMDILLKWYFDMGIDASRIRLASSLEAAITTIRTTAEVHHE
jgi:hypothetical protein